jgi:hypothetical protein
VRIRGVTENKTGIPMQVTQIGHSSTSEWCRNPEDLVRAHSGNGWVIGDDSAPLSMHIVYRLANGDEIIFLAQLRKPQGTETGCSFRTVVRTRREYECKAQVTVAGPDIAFVKFIVLAGPAAGTTSR